MPPGKIRRQPTHGKSLINQYFLVLSDSLPIKIKENYLMLPELAPAC